MFIKTYIARRASFIRKMAIIAAILSFILTFAPHTSSAFDVTVKSGAAKISKDGNTTTVIVGGKAILEGDTDIPLGDTVRVMQLSHDLLIRDTTPSHTEWVGKFFSDGATILVNTKSVHIAQQARTDAKSLIIATLDIKDELFMAGNIAFQRAEGAGPAKILNEADISVKNGGYLVCLSSGSIENEGALNAYLGSVALGVGEGMHVYLDKNGIINLLVDEGLTEQVREGQGNPAGVIKNSGAISADGGKVQVTAMMFQNVFDRLIDIGGVVRAVRSEERAGAISLNTNGGVVLDGKLEATEIAVKAGETLTLQKDVQIGAEISELDAPRVVLMERGDQRFWGDMTIHNLYYGSLVGDVKLNASLRASAIYSAVPLDSREKLRPRFVRMDYMVNQHR